MQDEVTCRGALLKGSRCMYLQQLSSAAPCRGVCVCIPLKKKKKYVYNVYMHVYLGKGETVLVLLYSSFFFFKRQYTSYLSVCVSNNSSKGSAWNCHFY